MRRKILSINLVFLIFVLSGCTKTVQKENSKGNQEIAKKVVAEKKEILEKEVVEKKEKCPIAKEQEEYDYFWNHYIKPEKLMSSVEYHSLYETAYSDKYFLIRKKHNGKLLTYIYDYECNLIETIELNYGAYETLMCTDGEENNSIMLTNFNHTNEIKKTKRSLQIHKKIIGDNSEPKLYIEIPCEEDEYISAFRWTKEGLFLEKEIDLKGGDTKHILYLLDSSKNLVKLMEYDDDTNLNDIKDDWVLMERAIREDTEDDNRIVYKRNRVIFKYNFKTKEKIDLPVLSYLSAVRSETLYQGDIGLKYLNYSFFNSLENFSAIQTVFINNYVGCLDQRTLILGSEFVLHSFNGVFRGYIRDGFIYTVRLNQEDEKDWIVDLYVVKKDNPNQEKSEE